MEGTASGGGHGGEGAVLRLQERLDDYMTNLRERLSLESLGLGPFLPPNVFDLLRGGLLQQPHELSLGHNALEGLPPELDLFTHLRTLVCTDNRLYALPKQIAALTSLQRLGSLPSPGWLRTK